MKYLLLLLLLASPVLTQTLSPSERTTLAGIRGIESKAAPCAIRSAPPLPEDDCSRMERELADLYTEAAKSPNLVKILAATAMLKYQQLENTAGNNKSAMQMSQIVDQQNVKLIPILIFQNQRIIELLEQIAKKPR